MLNRKENLVTVKMNFILLSVVVSSICGSVFGGNIETKSYPLFLYLDAEYYLPTSLYLKCDVIDYNSMPYRDFVSKENDERETTFKQIVNSLRENNLDEVLSLSYKKESMTEEDIEKHVQNAEGRITSCRKVFGDNTTSKKLDKLKIFHQIYIGDTSFITYGSEEMRGHAGRPYRLMIKLRPDPYKNILWDIAVPTKTRFIIQTLVDEMAGSPEKFIKDINKEFDFNIPFPGVEGSHETLLQFNGKRYNVNVCKDTVDPNDEVASLFQQQFFVIKNQSRVALAELYGGRSRENYLEWIQKADEASLKSGANYLDYHFKEMATVDRILRFILDADPLYIVFYQKEGKDKLLNQFIVRDPENGQLKFRNFYVLDFFKQWLDSPEVQSVLSDLILNN